MKKQNRRLLLGLVIAAITLSIVALIIVTQVKEKTAKEGQDDALTHDITTVYDYRSDYVGDNSNTVNLFYHLPLNSVAMNFEIDGTSRSLTVNYEETTKKIGSDKVRRDLIYNATAAMALIANVDELIFTFPDTYFIFRRSALNTIYNAELSNLLPGKTWKAQVQDKLKDDGFVERLYETCRSDEGE